MGNPRFNKPEQATAPLTLAGSENSDDILRSEVFTPQDRKTMSATQLTKKLDELIDHLENASERARRGDMEGATRAYATAIRTAEGVDQVSVARERRNIKQALKEKDLDPSQRRELLQKDADLHTLERAPGFALANYALVLIRMGDQFNGTKLLVRAQERDREMVEDPNFKRHLKQAIEEGALSQKSGTMQISAELPPGFPQPTIPNPARPTEIVTAPQPVAKPVVAPQPSPQFVPQPQQFAPQPSQQFYPQQPGYRGPSDVQPIQYAQPGVVRTDTPIPSRPEEARAPKISPLDEQKRTPIEAAAVLYAQVINEKTMSPAVFQQFMQTIANADAGISPRFQPYVQKQMESLKAIENFAVANPNIIAAAQAIDNGAMALIDRMQPQQKLIAAQLYNQMDRVGTQQERENAKSQLIAMDPTFKHLLEQRDLAIGPVLQKILMNSAQVQAEIEKQFQNKDNQAEFNQAAVTRFTFALALEKAGKEGEARAMMFHAITRNNSQDAAQNEFWKKTAARLGVFIADEAPRPGDPPRNPADGARVEPKPTGNAAEHVMYNLQKFKEATDSGASAAAVFAQMKPQFEQAIAKADAEFETVMKKIPQIEKLSEELARQITAETRAKSQAFAKQIIAEKEQMTPQVLELAKKFQNVALPDAERNALRPYLTQVAPKFVALNDQFEAFAGKEILTKLNQVLQDEHEVNNAIAGRFVTRLCMAQCADKAGDTNTAASKLVEGLAAVPGTYQKAYLQQKEVAELAGKVGLRQDQLPIAPDILLTRSDPPRETKGAEKGTIPGISEENQGLRPDQVLQQAKQMLRTEGMTAATKKQFEEGIKIADSLFNQNDTKDAETLLKWLKTGKKDNGQEVTAAEREQFHLLLNNTFARAAIGIQFRAQYAQLLLESKQYGTAQKMHLERIELADKLPLQLFKNEMEQLAVDMRNPNLSRMVKADLGGLFEQIGGSGTNKDDGLLYMPISARKQAIYFYVSGREPNSTVGIFKPDQAIDMVNETRAAELRLYGVDLTKNPNLDSQLRQMAKELEPLASDALKKEKGRWDTYWSNGFIDAGVGAVAVTGAAFLASLATRNPNIFKWALTGDKALTLGAKVGIGTVALGGAVAGRHYLHQAVTGQNEGWDTSAIHGTAGIAGIAGIYATRGLVNKVLFRGATEEGVILRATEAHGKLLEGAAAGSPKVLKVEQLGEFYAANNIRVPSETAKWMAEHKDLIVATGRTVDNAVFDLCKLGLNPAQSANLAKGLAPLAPLAEAGAEGAAATTPFLARLGERSLGGLKNAFVPFGKLDLATASSGQLGMRAFWGNWAQASGGIFALESVKSLDRDIDVKTGQKYSYAESLWNANYVSAGDNTLTRGLLLGTLAMRGGALPTNYYAKDASLLGKGWGYAKAPFTASRFGATTANSSYFQQGLKAGYLGFASSMYDFKVLEKAYVGHTEAKNVEQLLDKNRHPIENLAPPGVKAIEIPELAPAGGAPAAAPPPRGQTDAPLKDEAPPKPAGQPMDLTAGTPGF